MEIFGILHFGLKVVNTFQWSAKYFPHFEACPDSASHTSPVMPAANASLD